MTDHPIFVYKIIIIYKIFNILRILILIYSYATNNYNYKFLECKFIYDNIDKNKLQFKPIIDSNIYIYHLT